MNASTVHATLAKHYPAHVLGWVKRATWKHDPAVPLTRINMARRPGARNPEKVANIAAAVKAGKPMPPVVLVDTGDAKLQIADGYHRTLGFLHAGKRAIPAVIASGVGPHGPWEKRMHAAKLNLTAAPARVVDLVSGTHVYEWKHGWIPITPHAALQKAHGSHAGAARLLHSNGQHEDAHAMLRAGVAHHEALGHVRTAARYRQALATREPHPASHTLTHGDHATVRGVDQYGSPMTFSGRVSGRPTPVTVRKRGSSTGTPMLAVQMHNGSDTSGIDATARGTVYVPHDATHTPTAAPSPRGASGIEITHSGDGTLVHGTTRAEAPILKRNGFRWSSNLGAWYLPRNQHESTRAAKVTALESDLKAAGHEPQVTRSVGVTTTAAEREAAARARATDRAGRMDSRAERASAEAQSRHERAHQIADMIPMGQPILAGHHSQRRHERDLERMGSHMDKGIAADREAKAAKAAADRARATAAGDSPLLRQRRIDRNEAELRSIDRTLAAHDVATRKPEAAARVGIHPLQSEHHQRLVAARAELADQIAHDKAQIEASGHKTISAADIQPGDVIHYRGRNHIVKKVNKTTVSVPTPYSWDDKVPINQITKHVRTESTDQLEALVKNPDTSPSMRTAAEQILAQRAKKARSKGVALTADHTCTVDLAGVCTGPGPCNTTPLGTGKNWVTKVGGLPDYIRAIAHALRRNGHPESQAIQLAIGTVQRWARGEGNVTAATRARAAAALAEWERKKAQAHALTATPTATVDLTGPHGYRHGWIRVNAAEPTAVERATRAVITDGHAMLHGPGMVSAAQRIAERVRSNGHRVHVKRIHLDGKTHLHVRRTTR